MKKMTTKTNDANDNDDKTRQNDSASKHMSRDAQFPQYFQMPPMSMSSGIHCPCGTCDSQSVSLCVRDSSIIKTDIITFSFRENYWKHVLATVRTDSYSAFSRLAPFASDHPRIAHPWYSHLACGSVRAIPCQAPFQTGSQSAAATT